MLYFDLTGPLVFDMIGRCKSQIVARLDKRKPRGRWKKHRKQWQKVRWSKMQRGTHRRGILRYVEWVREGVGWNGLECKVTLWATLFKMNRQLHFWGGCRWRESSPAHSPVRLQPKNACRIAQACNRLPASSFWLVIDVQDRLGLICLRNRWTVIHLWLDPIFQCQRILCNQVTRLTSEIAEGSVLSIIYWLKSISRFEVKSAAGTGLRDLQSVSNHRYNGLIAFFPVVFKVWLQFDIGSQKLPMKWCFTEFNPQ